MNTPVLDPAAVDVRPGDMWGSGTVKFRVLTVTDTRVRTRSVVGRAPGRTSTIARVRFHPTSGGGYRLLKRP